MAPSAMLALASRAARSLMAQTIVCRRNVRERAGLLQPEESLRVAREDLLLLRVGEVEPHHLAGGFEDVFSPSASGSVRTEHDSLDADLAKDPRCLLARQHRVSPAGVMRIDDAAGHVKPEVVL